MEKVAAESRQPTLTAAVEGVHCWERRSRQIERWGLNFPDYQKSAFIIPAYFSTYSAFMHSSLPCCGASAACDSFFPDINQNIIVCCPVYISGMPVECHKNELNESLSKF